MLDIRQTGPNDWDYVSEGGATIVFSYRGPARPEFSDTVLRLRKVPLHQDNSAKEKSSPGDADKDDPIIDFQTKCLQKVVPSQYLPDLQPVHLEEAWLKDLSGLQNHRRPQNRREVDGIDLERKKGVLATDLVKGTCLSVEIKPKWAFLPSPTHLSKETKSVKTQTCRFCMHSYLKVREGQEAATDYCPLDLFSGDRDRVANAVSGLWKAWVSSNGSINNLKIFACGKAVGPSSVRRMLQDQDPSRSDVESIRQAFITALTRSLLASPVLNILSVLQRELDPLDIEGLAQLCQRAGGSPSSQSGARCLALPDPDISDWVDFLNTYTSRDKLQLDHANPSLEHLKYYMLAYLLSATFKDCSIFVRMDLLDLSRPNRSEESSSSITVVDLEPKPMQKLAMWKKLDREIAQTYALEVPVTQRKICVDAQLPQLG